MHWIQELKSGGIFVVVGEGQMTMRPTVSIGWFVNQNLWRKNVNVRCTKTHSHSHSHGPYPPCVSPFSLFNVPFFAFNALSLLPPFKSPTDIVFSLFYFYNSMILFKFELLELCFYFIVHKLKRYKLFIYMNQRCSVAGYY